MTTEEAIGTKFNKEVTDYMDELHVDGFGRLILEQFRDQFGYALQMKFDTHQEDNEFEWIPEVTTEQMESVLKAVLFNMIDIEFDS